MKELKSKTEKELQKSLRDKQEALRVFRFASVGSKTKDVREGRSLRRDIARILTELNRSNTTRVTN